MLAKLLKYEYKETARTIPFFYLVAALFALMALIGKKTGIGWFNVTSSVLLILVGLAVILVTFVLLVIRFYKNLYSNEGYLMFTLPVKPHQLMISKLIAAFTWMVASIAVFLGALLGGLHLLNVDISEFTGILNELKKYHLDWVVYAVGAFIFVQILYLLGQIYFSITFANRPSLQGLGVAASFLIFLATYVILQIVYMIFTIFVPFSVKVNLTGDIGASLSGENMLNFFIQSIQGAEPTNAVVGLGGYIFITVMVFVLFYITGRIMNKKISLK